MSELTPCNWCSLSRIRECAGKAGKKVTVVKDSRWGLGGVNVYVHPKDVDVRKMKGGEDGERAEYRVAWMMKVGKECEC